MRYSYVALQAGQRISGWVEAESSIEAARQLRSRQLTVVSLQQTAQEPNQDQGRWRFLSLLSRRVSAQDLIVFSRQMNSLVESGLPILRALKGLQATSSQSMVPVLGSLIEGMEKGRTLSDVMAEHPDVFNRFYVSIIKLGENTGRLDQSFAQLSDYLEQEQATQRQIKSATRYPLFVLVTLVVAFLLMNIMVIPVFAGMFARFGNELPGTTLFLLNLSAFIREQGYLLMAAVLLVVGGFYYWQKTEKGRLLWSQAVLKLPIFGDIIYRSLMTRFTRNFSTMLAAGIPITSALRLVSDSMMNPFLSSKIDAIRLNIERGDSLFVSASRTKIFSDLILQMISVGEETGRLADLLGDISAYYQREVEYDLKNLTARLEPILIAVVASMVLVLALGIFTPMWDMMGNMSR